MASKPIWGGLALSPLNAASAGIDAVTDFTFNNPSNPYVNVHTIWFTLTVKNDASIRRKAVEIHNQMVKELQTGIPDQYLASHVCVQPVPRLYFQQSHAANGIGNVLGLEQNSHDAILIQASPSIHTTELESWACSNVCALVDEVRSSAHAIKDGVLPWEHLIYAHSNQDVFNGYGPDNVSRMQEASSKYDPKGVFQYLCPGGLKISAWKN